MNKKRILVKISGGSLKENDEIFSYAKVENLAQQIKVLHKKYDISLVIGGGNIFRGNVAKQFSLNRVDADNMGMLATMINGILLNNIFNKLGIKTRLFSALKIDSIIDQYTVRDVNDALNQHDVCIFVGGTGSAFFTTDTGAALRAAETGSEWILMGKNGVDGVFDSDPLKNPKAKHFPFLQYNDLIKNNITIMDHSALTLCNDNNIGLLIFNVNHQNALVKAMGSEIQTTIIAKEKHNDWLKK